jgi:hypothetical protein
MASWSRTEKIGVATVIVAIFAAVPTYFALFSSSAGGPTQPTPPSTTATGSPPVGAASPSPQPAGQTLVTACQALRQAAQVEQSALVALHDSIQGDTSGNIVTGYNPTAFDSAKAAVDSAWPRAQQALREFQDAGGALPPEPEEVRKFPEDFGPMPGDLGKLYNALATHDLATAYAPWHQLHDYAADAGSVVQNLRCPSTAG